ncbi:unnamed protein product [Penicillium nalgiovense]|nr:unnamed protein product [Penicillium nalgiovense]
MYPFAVHERVLVSCSVIYVGVISFLIILARSAMMRPGLQKIQVAVLGLLVALMLTLFLTDVVKNAV